MKYIRTKDGIYLNGGEFGYPHVGIIGKKQENDFGFCFDKTDVIKQADTIEELCDEFVLIHTEYDNSKDIFEARSSGTWLQHRGDNYYSFGLEQVRSGKMNIKGSTLYGAIWTEWGLKYVAKMNDKGELELL